jgi:hypothetical protein
MAMKPVQATLKRGASKLIGTPGVFSVPEKGFVSASLELPWRDNKSGLSCIPRGTYRCVATMSAKYKRIMYLLIPTGSRTGIRIHSANFAGAVDHGYKCDLLGCLALGSSVIEVNKQYFLRNSRNTMKKFEAAMGGKNFLLTIE